MVTPTTPTTPHRRLAIAIRGKRLGYCISETPHSLLDWGVSDLKVMCP